MSEEKLTTEELNLLTEYRSAAVKHGTCTEPANWPVAEASISKLYAKINQPAPIFIRCISPSDMVVKHAVLSNNLMSVDEVVKYNEKSLSIPKNCTKTMLEQSISQAFHFHGCYEVGWPQYYKFCHAVLTKRGKEFKKEDVDNLNNWDAICQSCAWWAAFEGVCFMCDRPEIMSITEDQKLHNDSGPAFQFRHDQWSLWAIQDVQLPFKHGETIVMRPHEQTIADIENESNEEIRAIRIDRYGWARYLRDSGAETLDYRVNDIEGTHEALMRSKKGDLRLVCTCTTGRIFALGIESATGIKTCFDAQKWLHNDRPIRVSGRT